MTKDEIKKYIEEHGNAKETIEAVKALMAEGVEVTEESLTAKLIGDVDDEIDSLPALVSVPKEKTQEVPRPVPAAKPVQNVQTKESRPVRPVYKQTPEDVQLNDMKKEKLDDFAKPNTPSNKKPVKIQTRAERTPAPKAPQAERTEAKGSPLLIPMIIATILGTLLISVGSALTSTSMYTDPTSLPMPHPVTWIGLLLVSIVAIVSTWKIFTKAGRAGWKSLIPFYSTWVFNEIIFGKGAFMFFLFIPLFNIYWFIHMFVCLGRVFGKKGGFNVGMVFLTNIFTTILAFGAAQYRGPYVKK